MATRRTLRWIAIMAILFTGLIFWKGIPMISSFIQWIQRIFRLLFGLPNHNRIEPPSPPANQNARKQTKLEKSLISLEGERFKYETAFLKSPDVETEKNLMRIERQIDMIKTTIAKTATIPQSVKTELNQLDLRVLKNRLRTATQYVEKDFLPEEQSKKELYFKYAESLKDQISKYEAELVAQKNQQLQPVVKKNLVQPKTATLFRKSWGKPGDAVRELQAARRASIRERQNKTADSWIAPPLMGMPEPEAQNVPENPAPQPVEGELSPKQENLQDDVPPLETEKAPEQIPAQEDVLTPEHIPLPQKKGVRTMPRFLRRNSDWWIVIIIAAFLIVGIWLCVHYRHSILKHWPSLATTVESSETVVQKAAPTQESQPVVVNTAASKPADTQAPSASQPSKKDVKQEDEPNIRPNAAIIYENVASPLPDPQALCAIYTKMPYASKFTLEAFGKHLTRTTIIGMSSTHVEITNTNGNSMTWSTTDRVSTLNAGTTLYGKPYVQTSDSKLASPIGIQAGGLIYTNERGNRVTIPSAEWVVKPWTEKDNPPYELPDDSVNPKKDHDTPSGTQPSSFVPEHPAVPATPTTPHMFASTPPSNEVPAANNQTVPSVPVAPQPATQPATNTPHFQNVERTSSRGLTHNAMLLATKDMVIDGNLNILPDNHVEVTDCINPCKGWVPTDVNHGCFKSENGSLTKVWSTRFSLMTEAFDPAHQPQPRHLYDAHGHDLGLKDIAFVFFSIDKTLVVYWSADKNGNWKVTRAPVTFK